MSRGTLRPIRKGLAWAVVAFLAVNVHVEAQAREGPVRVWLALGLASGASTTVDANFGGTVRLVGQKGRHQGTVRFLAMGDFSSFPDGGSDDGVGEFGLLYGRSRTSGLGSVAVSAGLAVVAVTGCRAGEAATCNTVGIPFVAEASLQSTPIGIGLEAFLNLNPTAVFGGLALTVQLGWMP